MTLQNLQNLFRGEYLEALYGGCLKGWRYKHTLMQNLEQFDNFKSDILNEQLCDSLTAYIFTAKVMGGMNKGGEHVNIYAYTWELACAAAIYYWCLINRAVVALIALPKGTLRAVPAGNSLISCVFLIPLTYVTIFMGLH